MRKSAASVDLGFIEPQIPSLVGEPPEGDGWIHEIKFDGYRTQIVIDRKGVRAFSRNGHNWSDRYPSLIAAAAKLPAKSAIIDGEVIATDKDGKPSFKNLAFTIRRQPERLCFVAFDLLYLNGRDLRAEPLIERRAALEKLISAGRLDNIAFSQAFEGTGAAILKQVDRMGLEGIVSKRADRAYKSGPSKTWLKTKCFDVRDLDIIGVQREPGKPAMVLMADKGRYMGGAFVTLPQGIRERLWARVQARKGAKPPVGLKAEKAEWIKPGLRGRVKFLRGEEKLRHASLQSFEETDQ